MPQLPDVPFGSPVPPPRRPGRPKGQRQDPEVLVQDADSPRNSNSPGAAGREKVKTQVAMMRAAAVHPNAISRGLKISRDRINAILGQADTQGLVEDFRKILRAHALSQSLDISVKGMRWLNEVLEHREGDKNAPKAFELVSRGLGNMERLWSSAAGENRPQGVQVAVINQPGESPAAEIAKLIELLVPPAQP